MGCLVKWLLSFKLEQNLRPIMQIGKLIQKIQRHPKVEINMPPIVGPKIGPAAMTEPSVPIAKP